MADYNCFTMLFPVLSILIMTLSVTARYFKNFTRLMTLKASPLGNIRISLAQ